MNGVVVVDDDLNYLELVSMVLTGSCGVDGVRTFGDADAALRHLAGGARPQLVLLDLHMPRSHGLQVLHQLRSLHRQVPVAFLSGAVSEQERADCLAAGAVAVLTKPVGYAELVMRLRALVEALRPPLQ